MRILYWLKVLVVLLAIAAVAGYILFNTDWFQKKYLYPFPHKELIHSYSDKHNLDPHLVAAVVRTESKFIPIARSPKGAVGLMQMMPETGQWVASQLKVSNYSEDRLTEPETSIRFGTWYMASLKREFYDNDILSLAAYNAGRGNVKQWMLQYGWDERFKDIDQIPYRETRDYVKKVLDAKKHYDELYGH